MKLRPIASWRMRASPCPGCAASTSSSFITSGAPCSRITIALDMLLLVHAAGENRDHREERRLLRRSRELLQRIVPHVVQRWRKESNRVEQDADSEKDERHGRQTDGRLAPTISRDGIRRTGLVGDGVRRAGL